MYAADQIWTVLLFAVLVQGLFLGGVLFSCRGTDCLASRLLAVLCLVLALMTGEELVDSANLYDVLPHLALGSFALPLAIGPLMWLIALRLVPAPRRLGWRDLLHFLPLFAVFLYLSPFYLLDAGQKLAALDGEWGQRLGPLVLFKGVQVLAYQALAIVTCSRILARNDTPYPDRLVWYRRVLAVTFVPILVVHGLYFFPLPGAFESDRVGSLVVAVVIFAFAYAAMKWNFFRSASASDPVVPGKVAATVKYRTSSLDSERKQALREALLAHMKAAEPFRDPDISPADIADALGISAHDLSQLLNEVLQVNFHRFLNRYRIDWVKQNLADPRQEHKTLLQLAFEAGFNSKTSFNRAFKAHTGLTPSRYRARPPSKDVEAMSLARGFDSGDLSDNR